jgi:transposase
MTISRDHLGKADALLVAAIEAGAPALAQTRVLVEKFHSMIRKKMAGELDTWIAEAGESAIASFAAGVKKDRAAITAAITQPWSNSQKAQTC